MQARHRMPVVRAARPVRPPASTPAADSMKVVTVEVPVQAPATVPMASDTRASFMLGISPFSLTMPAREAVPTRVPMVSNMSIMQKVRIRVMAVNQPIWKKPAKSNLKKVRFIMSAKGGAQLAVLSPAKGSIPRKMASPAQLMTEATSMPSSTQALTPFLPRRMMTKRPMKAVTTVSTIWV